MKRRKFLKSSAAAGTAAVSATVAAPAIAQGITELRMVTTWPKNFPGLGTGAETLARRINSMSDGKMQVKVFAAGELVPAFESFDAVSSGNAQLSHSAAYYWQGKHKAFNFFTTVPFGLNAAEHATWVYHAGGQALWDELGAQFDIKPFLRASTGVQMGGWYRKEINTLDDYKGLKFRMPGLGGEVLRRLGAAVVNLPLGEIFQGLQSGTVDGTEWVGPWHDLAAGFYKVAKYYYWPGFHEPGTTGEVMVNKKTWDGLSQTNKDILEAAIQAEAWREFTEIQSHNADSLAKLTGTHGVELRQFSDELLGAIGKVATEVVEEVGTSDPLTTRVYESYRSFRDTAKGWARISEQAYMNARDSFA